MKKGNSRTAHLGLTTCERGGGQPVKWYVEVGKEKIAEEGFEG